MSSQQALPLTAKTPGDAAALWWVAVLTKPRLDNGDDGSNPMMTIMITMAEAGPHPVAEELAEFGGILARKVNEALEDSPNRYRDYGFTLSVDYDPDRTLSDAADEAGFRLGMGQWPWKTTMWVKPDEVSVRYGRGGDIETIWTDSN